ncbi:MAG: sulfatase-like hydrolase/transferase [Proteobacteria bacterium]|nr:sulfatase-like hydrolase/transferase [Pseudomonadota bacterium]
MRKSQTDGLLINKPNWIIRIHWMFRNRAFYYFTGMTFLAAVIECVVAWPAGRASLALGFLTICYVLALTMAWTLPLSLLASLGEVVVRNVLSNQPKRSHPRNLGVLILLPPAAFIGITVCHRLLVWAAGAFVQVELRAALTSVVLLLVYTGLTFLVWLAYLALRSQLERLPRRVHIGFFLLGGLATAGIHFGRFSEVCRDPLFFVLVQVGASIAFGLAVGVIVPRWTRWRLKWIPLLVAFIVVVGLWSFFLQGGRYWSYFFPMVSANVQSAGLTGCRVAQKIVSAGDGDGDGFIAAPHGLDCDDDNPKVHPLAKDVPGNGIDEDCFEGDISPNAIAADKRQRKLARGKIRKRVKNILLVTVDALRADATGIGGSTLPTTPRLDKLAGRSAVFTKAYAQGANTRRSVPSMLTGLYPSNVHWQGAKSRKKNLQVHDSNRFLAEVLGKVGIQTGMAAGFIYPKASRSNQGFKQQKIHHVNPRKETSGDLAARDAIAMMEAWSKTGANSNKAAPFFLWVHFYEPHLPYLVHKGAANFGKSRYQKYSSEVRFVDEQFGRILDALDSLGLTGDTAILFSADHGEEFKEHGGTGHGDLYLENLHVPLVVAVPGAAPQVVSASVELVDIMPTILELLGQPVSPELDGMSLVSFIDGTAVATNRYVFSETIPDGRIKTRTLSLIDLNWQLIVDYQLGSRELFDLKKDPQALHNILAWEPDQAQRMETALRRLLALRVGPMRYSNVNSSSRKSKKRKKEKSKMAR